MINHALTGALIGLTVDKPVIALPVAFLSHFICDAIPHHGSQIPDNKNLRTKFFRNTLYLDIALSVSLVFILATKQPLHWLIASICSFLATSPDALYINRYIKTRRRKAWKSGKVVKWAIDIQWFQRPIGAVVEAAWFAGAIVLISAYLR